MKRIHKRTFYYKYSLIQKMILTIPIFSLIVLLIFPVSDEAAKIGNVALFFFSIISLLLILRKRNYIKWDLNSIEIKVKGNDKIFLAKNKFDKMELSNFTLSISIYNEDDLKINLKGLSEPEIPLFINTFEKALNETDNTDILFHNYNKMSLIYKE